MVTGDGLVKILDFGLAKLDAAQHDPSGVRHWPGSVLGTPALYVARTGARGTGGPATDLFSLGLVIYELATARHPFQAATLPATVVALAHDEAAPPSSVRSDLPSAFDDLALGLLAKDPTTASRRGGRGLGTGRPRTNARFRHRPAPRSRTLHQERLVERRGVHRPGPRTRGDGPGIRVGVPRTRTAAGHRRRSRHRKDVPG